MELNLSIEWLPFSVEVRKEVDDGFEDFSPEIGDRICVFSSRLELGRGNALCARSLGSRTVRDRVRF